MNYTYPIAPLTADLKNSKFLNNYHVFMRNTLTIFLRDNYKAY